MQTRRVAARAHVRIARHARPPSRADHITHRERRPRSQRQGQRTTQLRRRQAGIPHAGLARSVRPSQRSSVSDRTQAKDRRIDQEGDAAETQRSWVAHTAIRISRTHGPPAYACSRQRSCRGPRQAQLGLFPPRHQNSLPDAPWPRMIVAKAAAAGIIHRRRQRQTESARFPLPASPHNLLPRCLPSRDDGENDAGPRCRSAPWE